MDNRTDTVITSTLGILLYLSLLLFCNSLVGFLSYASTTHADVTLNEYGYVSEYATLGDVTKTLCIKIYSRIQK